MLELLAVKRGLWHGVRLREPTVDRRRSRILRFGVGEEVGDESPQEIPVLGFG